MTSFIDALNWRYATKKFDTTKKLTSEQVDLLLEAARLAPSSAGLQPWKFIHVTDSALRQQLLPLAYGQTQVVDASDFFVFAVNKNVDEKYVENYIAKMASDRNIDVSVLEAFKTMVIGNVNGQTEDQKTIWSGRQVYIALGFMLAAAAVSGIDAAPMEGFDADAFDKVLGLDTLNLHALAIVSAGFRAADDAAAGAKKSRFDKSDVVIIK
jgi:nitroreductase/dihydropteridine reductase